MLHLGVAATMNKSHRLVDVLGTTPNNLIRDVATVSAVQVTASSISRYTMLLGDCMSGTAEHLLCLHMPMLLSNRSVKRNLRRSKNNKNVVVKVKNLMKVIRPLLKRIVIYVALQLNLLLLYLISVRVRQPMTN